MNKFFAMLLTAGCVAPVVAGDAWPGWRGPGRDGVVPSGTLPASLSSSDLSERWSVPLGPSYSGPVVAEGRVFVTESLDDREVVRAFDAATGDEVWATDWVGSMSVIFIAKPNGDWIKATPAYADGALYVAGMRDVLVRLDAETGAVEWRTDFKEEFGTELPPFGFVSSPLVDGGKVFVQAGRGLCRIDADSGAVDWRILKNPDPYGSAFSSPIVATVAGRRQLVVQTRKELVGVNPETADVLWRVEIPAFRDTNILTPTVVGNRVFTSTFGGGSRMVEVRAEGDGFAAEVVWTNKAQGYMSSPVVADGALFLHMRNQRLACLDVTDGTTRWISKPMGKYASLVTDGDRVLVLDERGELLLLDAAAEDFEALARRDTSDGTTWAYMGVTDDALLVRPLDRLIVFDR
ncbi:MAG: PQQ-binding-like beta-propeller repeat protein [Planctomycetota bacterium]